MYVFERFKTRYEVNSFQTREHAGTHVDAPSHFFKGQQRLDEVPVERFIGPAVVVDIKSKVESNYSYELSIDDLKQWEDQFGKIPNKAIVVMDSGWSSRYPDKNLVFNTETPNDPSTYHFPGFNAEGVKWLVKERDINMIAVDSPSVDFGQTSLFLTHITCGYFNLPTVEGIANISEIPRKGATIFVGAIKLDGGSGGPARVIATWDEISDNDRGDNKTEL